MEVRLSKEAELNELITATIKSVFKKRELIPSSNLPTSKRPVTISEQTALELDNSQVNTKSTFKNPSNSGLQQYRQKEALLPTEEMKKLYEPAEKKISPGFIANEPQIEEVHETEESIVENPLSKENKRIPPLYPIGQMHGTYIFAQNDQGFYMIDQHAAQERIKYEYYREKVGEVDKEVQEMLVPLHLEFSRDEFIKIEEYKHDLEQIGIFLEDFGMNSYMIRSHPSWFPKGQETEIIEEMIEQLLTMKKIDIKKIMEEAAIMMSCKASIKANQYLRNDEIQALLNELRKTEDPFTCPHGRPIIIHFSTNEIEKMFKRIM